MTLEKKKDRRYKEFPRPKYWKERSFIEKCLFWKDYSTTQYIEFFEYEDATHKDPLAYELDSQAVSEWMATN